MFSGNFRMLAELQLFAPAPIVLHGEDHLDRFGAARARYTKSLKCLPDLSESRVRMFGMVRWGALNPVKNRSNVEKLASHFEEISVQNFPRFSCI